MFEIPFAHVARKLASNATRKDNYSRTSMV